MRSTKSTSWFQSFANATAKATGQASSFGLAAGVVVGVSRLNYVEPDHGYGFETYSGILQT